ncbi:MAG: host-nuclease inhibitor Gam family protein [Helicobacteraceae bacterium]|jgi:phage host-nuclease inhibitor protein Gam|nr:host-nuclease inhibitor Gam family protein [Helicobacteraceae bacterium]
MERVSSWNDVDIALKEIGECEIKIANIEGEATIAINEIKEAAKPKIAPFAAKKEHLEKLVTLFCEGNKSEFADKRSKQFNFGEVGYRLVKSVALPRVREKIAALIKSIKAYGYGECVAAEETINKEMIVELEDAALVKLGLKRTIKDSFRIVPKLEAIEPAAA